MDPVHPVNRIEQGYLPGTRGRAAYIYPTASTLRGQNNRAASAMDQVGPMADQQAWYIRDSIIHLETLSRSPAFLGRP